MEARGNAHHARIPGAPVRLDPAQGRRRRNLSRHAGARRSSCTSRTRPSSPSAPTAHGDGREQTHRLHHQCRRRRAPPAPITRCAWTRRDGEPRPYVLVRGRLEARVLRAPFYELVEWGEPREGRLGCVEWGRVVGVGGGVGCSSPPAGSIGQQGGACRSCTNGKRLEVVFQRVGAAGVPPSVRTIVLSFWFSARNLSTSAT